jgi:hypothetical protein
VNPVLPHLIRLFRSYLAILSSRLARCTKPHTSSLLLGLLADLGRSKSQLIAENAFLRKPLIILSRKVKRPACTQADRTLLVLLARSVYTWQHALFIVQPETLLRWHRELFRLVWKRKSKAASHTPKIAAETIAFVREMTVNNRLWGAERIRGELLQVTDLFFRPLFAFSLTLVLATKDICLQKRRLKGGDVVVKQALFERMCQVASTVVSFHHKGRARWR